MSGAADAGGRTDAPSGSTGPGAWDALLEPGEEIVWQGRPGGGIVIRPSDLPISLFGLFFAGFAAFWIAMAASMTSGEETFPFSVFPLFGLPFLAVGLYLVFGRFLWQAWRRRRTFYTLTNRRAFIGSELLGQRTLATYDLADPDRLELVEERGGRGTVWFAERTYHGSRRRRVGSGRRRTAHTVPVGFEMIEDAPKVFRLIREAQRSLSPQPEPA